MNLSPKQRTMLANAKAYIQTVSRQAELAQDMVLAHALSEVAAALHTIMIRPPHGLADRSPRVLAFSPRRDT